MSYEGDESLTAKASVARSSPSVLHTPIELSPARVFLRGKDAQ